MCPVVMVIANVLAHEALRMTLIENVKMVEQIAAVPNPSVRNAVLPWAAKAGSLGLETETPHGVNHFFIEVRPAIKN